MIGQFNGVLLFCQSVPKVATFYRDILGFSHHPTPEFATHRFYVLASGGCLLKLHSASKPNEGRQKLQIIVDDLAEARTQLQEAGIRCGKIQYGYFDAKDPEGNIVQFHPITA